MIKTDYIGNVLKEAIIKYDNENSRVKKIINETFKNTKLYNNDKFINESAYLISSNKGTSFIKHLYESAEAVDALLDICVLTFSTENTKTGSGVVTFSLPAGWSCPFANTCLKKVNRDRVMDPDKVGTTKISRKTGAEIEYKGDVVVNKGKDTTFDCYAANQEMQYDAIRSNRWHNFDLLKAAGDANGQAELIIKSLNYYFDTEGDKTIVRIHESGDFYNGEYLRAWIITASKMPHIKFYAYTKSIPYLKQMEKELAATPNLIITLSKGGKRDSELGDVNIKESHVFNTPEEVLQAGLLVDLDDTLSQNTGGKEANFALLVHGTQVAGEMGKNKGRNETFMAYWKYRKKLNRQLGKPEDYFLSFDEADTLLKQIYSIDFSSEKSRKRKSDLEFIGKLLRYVKKYYNYNFDPKLINIIPGKYR